LTNDTSDDATALAQQHWNATPLFFSEEERYGIYPWLYDVAEFRNHANERVLEIGCGTGCDLLQFMKNGARATGVDVTDRHLELARARIGPFADVQKADARSLPFRDATFDYVYSHGVLHHIAEPDRVVREILRVLKPGGRFNVHVYARYSGFVVYMFLRYGFGWKRWIENSRDPVHIELYTARKLRRLFSPIPIGVTKHFMPKFPELVGRYVGWYLVAKGTKPSLPLK
jgi:SAM-dependent methyltransferase